MFKTFCRLSASVLYCDILLFDAVGMSVTFQVSFKVLENHVG